MRSFSVVVLVAALSAFGGARADFCWTDVAINLSFGRAIFVCETFGPNNFLAPSEEDSGSNSAAATARQDPGTGANSGAADNPCPLVQSLHEYYADESCVYRGTEWLTADNMINQQGIQSDLTNSVKNLGNLYDLCSTRAQLVTPANLRGVVRFLLEVEQNVVVNEPNSCYESNDVLREAKQLVFLTCLRAGYDQVACPQTNNAAAG